MFYLKSKCDSSLLKHCGRTFRDKYNVECECFDNDTHVCTLGDSDVDELLHRTGKYLVSSTTLPKGILQIKQCVDANKKAPSKVSQQCI